jgi:uncharacterized protein
VPWHRAQTYALPMQARHVMSFLAFLVVSLSAGATPAAAALPSRADSLPIPVLTGRVNDTASVLTPSERQQLTDVLAVYERETHHQIAVLTVPNLSGESIEAYSLRVANAWGIGMKGFDDGILVTLSMAEREIRIELRKGMQRYISDSDAKVVIDQDMVPAFKKGDFGEGLEAGLRHLMAEGRRYVIKPSDGQAK